MSKVTKRSKEIKIQGVRVGSKFKSCEGRLVEVLEC